jgi:hypothetical protein
MLHNIKQLKPVSDWVVIGKIASKLVTAAGIEVVDEKRPNCYEILAAGPDAVREGFEPGLAIMFDATVNEFTDCSVGATIYGMTRAKHIAAIVSPAVPK